VNGHANPPVSAILVAASEPASRLYRAAMALSAQRGADVIELIVAAPETDHRDIKEALSNVGIDVRLVTNTDGMRSRGLNRALEVARGTIICRVDARSALPTDYLVRTIARLESDPAVGVVGGVQTPVAGATSLRARGISRALANPWALGGAAYRVGRSGPADTVYLGVFRRHELQGLGGWDVRMVANEDFELCQRYRRRGMTVWVDGSLSVSYESRATLGELAAQYRAFGQSKAAYWRATGNRPAHRQKLAIAGAAASGGVVCLALARRPCMLPALLASGATALLALDAVGGDPGAPIQDRLAAVVAYGTLWASWLAGIVDGLRAGRL
jgi:succinoglycan biosynthesis protein ExoA